jgi:hypothetical protein
MNNPRIFGRRARLVGIALLVTAGTAAAQTVEVSPLVGTRQFGTVKLDSEGPPRADAHMAGSIPYGVAAGYRHENDTTEDHDLVEFRWMRQDSHLYIKQNPLQVTPYSTTFPGPGFRPSVTLDHFLADFTHEFAVPEARMIQPFITIGFGASYLSTAASGMTRFAFDTGAGIKVFPTLHYGFRLSVEYLPTVMVTDIQRLVCAGGCVVILSGGMMNQLNISFGPAFRF